MHLSAEPLILDTVDPKSTRQQQTDLQSPSRASHDVYTEQVLSFSQTSTHHPMSSNTLPEGHGPPSVIHAALMRTGTVSMARAYEILGLRAHHGLDIEHITKEERLRLWSVMERAADSTWPEVSGTAPRKIRFGRADWDEAFGSYDVVTEVGAFFADQLVEAYPKCKVVIVQRDFDTWWPSFKTGVIDGLFHPVIVPIFRLLWKLLDDRSLEASRKIMLGAFHARNEVEIEANARKTWEEYHEHLRAIIPPEQRLEYRLGDGWEPLCKFLDKEVPDVPFPNSNNAEELRKKQARQTWMVLKEAMVALLMWPFWSR